MAYIHESDLTWLLVARFERELDECVVGVPSCLLGTIDGRFARLLALLVACRPEEQRGGAFWGVCHLERLDDELVLGALGHEWNEHNEAAKCRSTSVYSIKTNVKIKVMSVRDKEEVAQRKPNRPQ